MESRFPIVICGGGVAGLILGIRLRQLGLAPLLIEKEKGVRPQPKGEFFQPQAVAILRDMKLLDLFLEKSVPIHKLSHAFKNPITGKLQRTRFRYGDYRGIDFGLSILHEDILLLLRKEYARLGGELWEGIGIRDLTELNDGYAIDLSDGREIFAELLVGADGRYSATRKMAGMELVEGPCDRMMMAVLVQGLVVPEGEFYTEEVPGGVLYAFHSSGDLVRAYICFHKAEFETANRDRRKFFLRKLRSTSLKGRTRARIVDTPMIMPTMDFMMPKIYSGRGIWFGDAAGAVDPLGGHGMAVALADAIRIADCLKRVNSLSALANKIIETEFQEVSETSRQEYLHARFIGKWVGTLVMEDSALSRLAKWKAMRRYERDPALKAYLIELFAGTNRSPLGLYELPYLLGMLPTPGRNLLKGLRLSRLSLRAQDRIMTTPLSLVRARLLASQ